MPIDPKVCHGRLCIKGTRIWVNLAEGVCEQELLQAYPQLTIEDIRAALSYAAESGSSPFRSRQRGHETETRRELRYPTGRGVDWGELAYLLPFSLPNPSEAVEPLAELLGRFLRRPSAPRAAMTALHLARAYLSLGLEAKARATLAEASWALEGLSAQGRAFLAGQAAFFQEVFALLEPAPKLRLHFLGGETVWLEGAPLQLTPRHREILVALVLNPAGLSAEQLALRVWGEGSRPEVAKAEVQRLRQRLTLVVSRPYRLSGRVWADFVELRERLLHGNLQGALALYGGPLLPGSDAPVVTETREEISSLLKKTLLSQGAIQPAFELAMQEEDPEFWQAILAQLHPGDPRRVLLEARWQRFWSTG